MNINIITNNQFQVTGLNPSTQYWYTVNDSPDVNLVQYITGTFSTDGLGASSVIVVENTDIVDWSGVVRVYSDATLATEETQASGQNPVLLVTSEICEIKPILSGCMPDTQGINQLRCWKEQFEADIHQLSLEGKCLKNLNFTPVLKTCRNCETGLDILVIDVCESLKALITAYFLARN